MSTSLHPDESHRLIARRRRRIEPLLLGALALGCASTPETTPAPRAEPPAAAQSQPAAATPAPRSDEVVVRRLPPPPPPITVVSFNILAAKFGVDRVGDALATLDADVIGLQEVDRGTRRARGVDVLEALAQRLGMHAAFGKALDFDGGEYGVALLSRAPLTRVRRWPLPVGDGAEPRVLLTARTRLAGQDWTVAVTHFSSPADGADAPSWHRGQARAVAEALGGRDATILLADLNAEASSVALVPLSIVGDYADLQAGPTYPARQPLRRIDHILRSADLRIDELRVIDTGVSDHRALRARIGRRQGEG